MASSEMGSSSGEAGWKPSSTLEQAKSDAGRLARVARTRTYSYVEDRKMHMAENLVGVAKAAHDAAQQLDQHGNVAVAEYVHRAADGLERFSDTIRDRDIASLMNDAEDFARRQPAVFVGASLAIGFLLARFLRSSSERRHAERHGYGGHGRHDWESESGRRDYPEGRGGQGSEWQGSGDGFVGVSRPGGPIGGGAGHSSAGGPGQFTAPASASRPNRDRGGRDASGG